MCKEIDNIEKFDNIIGNYGEIGEGEGSGSIIITVCQNCLVEKSS